MPSTFIYTPDPVFSVDQSPLYYQAITWTNADFLSTGSIQKNLYKFKHFHTIKCILKCYQKNVAILFRPQCADTLNPGQNGWHFADIIFKCMCMTKKYIILTQNSLKLQESYCLCKCRWSFRTASEIGRSPHLVAVTWKYRKLILSTILWCLVYAYVTIRRFIVVKLQLLARKYINEHHVIHDYGLCAGQNSTGWWLKCPCLIAI